MSVQELKSQSKKGIKNRLSLMGMSLDHTNHPKEYYIKLYLEKSNAKNKITRGNTPFYKEEKMINRKRERITSNNKSKKSKAKKAENKSFSESEENNNNFEKDGIKITKLIRKHNNIQEIKQSVSTSVKKKKNEKENKGTSNSNSQIKKLRRRDNLNRLKGEKDDFYYYYYGKKSQDKNKKNNNDKSNKKSEDILNNLKTESGKKTNNKSKSNYKKNNIKKTVFKSVSKSKKKENKKNKDIEKDSNIKDNNNQHLTEPLFKQYNKKNDEFKNKISETNKIIKDNENNKDKNNHNNINNNPIIKEIHLEVQQKKLCDFLLKSSKKSEKEEEKENNNDKSVTKLLHKKVYLNKNDFEKRQNGPNTEKKFVENNFNNNHIDNFDDNENNNIYEEDINNNLIKNINYINNDNNNIAYKENINNQNNENKNNNNNFINNNDYNNNNNNINTYQTNISKEREYNDKNINNNRNIINNEAIMQNNNNMIFDNAESEEKSVGTSAYSINRLPIAFNNIKNSIKNKSKKIIFLLPYIILITFGITFLLNERYMNERSSIIIIFTIFMALIIFFHLFLYLKKMKKYKKMAIEDKNELLKKLSESKEEFTNEILINDFILSRIDFHRITLDKYVKFVFPYLVKFLKDSNLILEKKSL